MQTKKNYNSIRKKLLQWYSSNKNEYPWRKTNNLFQILITEILLQKTIAVNVAKIYNNFFKKYNNFLTIYKADIKELQESIKELGLSNKRSKILKDVSNLVISKNNGVIPKDPNILKKIKGIGEYIVNAYLCFGLNERTLFYDVNIKRVILRVFIGIDTRINKEIIEKILELLLPEKDYKHFYWAILDFGNKICKKKKPQCNSCPILKYCSYFLNQIKKS